MLITRDFESSSSAAVYHAQFDTDTGVGSCTYVDAKGKTQLCPAFKFSGAARSCKHTKELAGQAPPPPKPSKRGAPAKATKTAAVAPSAPPVSRMKPMLASAMTDGATLDDFTGPGWVLEEKFDGHRVVLCVIDHDVTAWSRPRAGSEPLARELPPHVEASAAQLPDGIYDGELYVPGGTSSDVTRLDRQLDLCFVAFDVLAVLGQSTLGKPYTERREALTLALEHLDDNATAVVFMAKTEPVSLDAVKAIWSRGGEGAIVKRLSSPYRPGWRSPDWVKVKRHAAATLTITGFVAGKCGPYSVAALRADDGRETTVKTLDNATRAAIALNPEAFIGRRLVIAYIEQTSKGNFRHGTWDHLLDAEHAAWDSGERREYAMSPAVEKRTRAAHDPHCTCPDCITDHAAQLGAPIASDPRPYLGHAFKCPACGHKGAKSCDGYCPRADCTCRCSDHRAITPDPAPSSTPPAPKSRRPTVNPSPAAVAPTEAPIASGRKAVDWRAAGLKAAETRRRRLAEAAAGGVA